MLERSNYPDDWNSHWRRCDFHNHTYHASEWCHYCQDEDEQDEQEELVAVELTAKFILFVTIYHGDHDQCEMTKVKGAIEAFDFVKLQSESYIVKEWGHIFEVDNKLWIYITEDEADMCEVPEPSWWKQSTELDHVLGVSND